MNSYNDFVEDYNNPNITAHEVRRKNQLNSKQYTKIRNIAVTNGDIPKVRHMNRTNAKFYSRNNDGTYEVSKQYSNGKKLYVGRFPNEANAKKVVKICLDNNWELTEDVLELIDEYKVKHNPKNYSLVNGYYVIQKSINGKNIIFATIKKEKIDVKGIEKIVSKFREYGWNKSCKDEILRLFGVS